MKQNPWACLRAEFAIHHSRCALAFASHDTAKAHAYVLIERIAKPLRYCRIMHMKHRNDLPGKASQGAIEPWRASSDGFVKHKKSASIIRTVSYRRSVSSVRVYARRYLMPQFSYYIKTIHKFFYKGKCPFLCTKPQKLCIIKANKRKLWEVALHEKLFKGS